MGHLMGGEGPQVEAVRVGRTFALTGGSVCAAAYPEMLRADVSVWGLVAKGEVAVMQALRRDVKRFGITGLDAWRQLTRFVI
eukprot:1137714-Prorocentrum_minimum.AAC.1